MVIEGVVVVLVLVRFGADMDPLSMILMSLIGAGSNLLGQSIQASGQANANQMNMTMNTGSWKAQQINQEAQALGVSPLAILQGGSGGGVVPMQNVQSGAGAAGAAVGQNLSRAISAAQSGDDRLQKLQIEHQQLVNAGLAQDIASKNAKASVDAARSTALPPPIPAFGRFVDPRTGDTWWARTKDYAESSFAGDPVQMLRGVGSSLEDTFPVLKGLSSGWNLGSRLHDFVTRPDVSQKADPFYPDW